MDKYIVAVTVGGMDYFTDIKAESNLEAEHRFLDQGQYINEEYTVSSAQAFSASECKTDCFVGMVLTHQFIGCEALLELISMYNAKKTHEQERDKVLDEVESLTKALEEAKSNLTVVETLLEGATRAYNARMMLV